MIELINYSDLPLEITLDVSLGEKNAVKVMMNPLLLNGDVCKLDQVLDFIEELRKSSALQIDNLEDGTTVLKEAKSIVHTEVEIEPRLRDFISDAAVVSKAFGKPLRLPMQIHASEVDSIKMLKRIVTGEKFSDVEITAKLNKKEQNREAMLDALKQNLFTIKLNHLRGWQDVKIFGHVIDPGPIVFTGEGTSFIDIESIAQAYAAADEGRDVIFHIRCDGECWYTKGTQSADFDVNHETQQYTQVELAQAALKNF